MFNRFHLNTYSMFQITDQIISYSFFLLISAILPQNIFAQTIDNLAPLRDLVPPQQPQPLPEQPLQPPKEEVLPTPPPSPLINPPLPETAETITVTEFQFTGNTVFSASQLETQVAPNLRYKLIPLSRLLQVANDVAKSNYFLWRGQLQYVHLFAPDTLILARVNIQLSDRTILPLERFVLGGFGTVRGYPQNFRLTDSGVITTVEPRLPVFRQPQEQILLQLIPFVDLGTGWNKSIAVIQPNTLTSIGLGLSFQYRALIDARLDYGIPLTEVNKNGNSLQENGLTFRVIFTPF